MLLIIASLLFVAPQGCEQPDVASLGLTNLISNIFAMENEGGNASESSRGEKRQKVMVEERRMSLELWMEGQRKEAKVIVTHSEKCWF
ncbi:hypothetical protein FNV43_RR15760 [Rhamnella rubrinervis]|uniref:Uncharacterized protein n=1 Tax=Rhamnella rubrinervis TaxID=2594499 RepID=A0A8K0E2C6_9ROSA|nr:hypothetical protein FNV43_RR15760 [Rhamnella rubrinervis]